MAFKAGIDPKCKKPNYNGYYKEGAFKSLYAGTTDCKLIIEKAHKLRNENPLSHSSAGLIDNDSSSEDLMSTKQELDRLINQYAVDNML